MNKTNKELIEENKQLGTRLLEQENIIGRISETNHNLRQKLSRDEDTINKLHDNLVELQRDKDELIIYYKMKETVDKLHAHADPVQSFIDLWKQEFGGMEDINSFDGKISPYFIIGFLTQALKRSNANT